MVGYCTALVSLQVCVLLMHLCKHLERLGTQGEER